uniref:Uncharacterized protein n=1 Tax=Arundo donax TaxID=35708 RepID=A0A0A9DNX9_ARUDO
MAVICAGPGIVVDLDDHPRRHLAEVSLMTGSSDHHTLKRHLQTRVRELVVRQGQASGQRSRGNQGKKKARQHEESKKRRPLVGGVLHLRRTTVLLSTLL